MKNINEFRNMICGIDKIVPLLDGSKKQYIFFDNAASTPSLNDVNKTVLEFLEWYSAVHRAAGFKSIVSTKAYDDAHGIIGEFVGADLDKNTVIIVKNTTEAINKLATRLNLSKDDIVISSWMEHHSNDLPYRKYAQVEYIDMNEDGSLNEDDYKSKLEKYKDRVKLVAISGASNITGICNPIHKFAGIAHSYGAKFLVDAAQLAPHKKIDMLPENHPEHIDFLVFSAHKMYSPFGIGVLIAPKKVLADGAPDHVGGGTVKIVTHEKVYWADLPDKEEAGSPNVVGTIALAKAIKIINEFTMEALDEHEKALTKYALERFNDRKEIKVLGPSDPDNIDSRLGVICFNIGDLHNQLVSSILSAEGGIGVRSGCFCAHSYLKRLMKVTEKESDEMIKNIINGDRSELPGAVRVSFGAYNTLEEIDDFFVVIDKIIKNEYKGKYQAKKYYGTYQPEGFVFNFSDYFEL
jgi:selenocysteine lyase/cysteine desulfurase